MDGGLVAQLRASTVQQGREVYAALLFAANFHCLVDAEREVNLSLTKTWRPGSIGQSGVRQQTTIGEALIWCRKCSGHARQRLRPKVMILCKPENMDTKEDGQMMN